MAELNFQVYIQRLLKSVNPSVGLSGGALDSVNEIINSLTRKIARAVNVLLGVSGKVTVTVKEVDAALSILLGERGSSQVTIHGNKAIKAYNASADSGTKSVSERANLILSVSRVRKLLRNTSVVQRQGLSAGLYLAGALEYIVKDILAKAGDATGKNKVRITNRILLIAIRNDKLLNKLLAPNSTILAGGVVLE